MKCDKILLLISLQKGAFLAFILPSMTEKRDGAIKYRWGLVSARFDMLKESPFPFNYLYQVNHILKQIEMRKKSVGRDQR